ncbi:unnamed protein product [Vicia faba]|uniref:Riboflavin biosynthesis protein PYRD, chloroplastic n=1 Tax=Vicia faba TaxID=3906 RepID=A0AAV1AB46_VICFA|nr:unnamed protein product [Vicia faba]
MQAMGLSVAVSVPFYHSRLCINASPHPPIPLNLNHGFSKSLTFRDRLTRGKSSYVIRSQKNRDDDGDVDGFYMRKSVELARKALGCTSPNPLVGCVIVKDGQIVGQGFHPKPGQPHAEVFALRDAADLDENATAYVTLEPCNHFGRTPPCTEVLIKARLKKVVVGMVDPNPIVASKGLDRLRGAGIEVVVGVEEELCKGLNEGYIHHMLTQKPLLTLRYSLSVNGNLLDSLGNGVTHSGGYYSMLLQEYDAVILSSSLFRETLSVDSVPSSQEPGANQPIRFIMHRDSGSGSSNQIPFIIDNVTDKMIIFTDCITTAPEETQQGIKNVSVDQINLDVILDYCNRQGLCSVLLDMRGNFSEYQELVKEDIRKKYINKFVTNFAINSINLFSNPPLHLINGLPFSPSFIGLGDDEAISELDHEIRTRILREKSNADNTLVAAEQKVSELEAQLEGLRSAPSQKDLLDKEKEMLQGDVIKFHKIIDEFGLRIELKERDLVDKEKQLQAKVVESDNICQENKMLKKKVESQPFNTRDVERMKRELQAAERDAGEAELARNDWEEKCWELDRTLANNIRDLEPITRDCNQALKRLKIGNDIQYVLNPKGTTPAEIMGICCYRTVNQNYANILLMLLRLRQACDHPLLVKEYNSDPVGKDSVEMAKRLPKEMLINLFNSLETTAAICFVCNRPENKLGDDETWDRAESALKEALDECGKGNVFVKNLAKSIDNVGLHDLFQEYGNILSSKIVISEDGKSKGFGYIQFGSEESANDAIQKMNGSTVRDKQIYVGKFIRKSERSLPEPDAKYTNLYVKNLDPDITEALLKEKFSSFGKILSLAIVKDEKGLSKGFGFMNYENPDDARRATEAMNGSQFGSKNLYVARAQKKVEREKILHQWFAERCMEKNLKYKDACFTENHCMLLLLRGKMLGKAYCSSSIHTGVVYHHPKGSTTFYHHSSGSIGLESPADGRRSSESSYRIGDNGTSGGTN